MTSEALCLSNCALPWACCKKISELPCMSNDKTTDSTSAMQGIHPRILIVAENASAKFGGEAALPMHYFRKFRAAQLETWLIAHERTRAELSSLFPQDFDRIYFVPDTIWHRLLWNLGSLLPRKLANMTLGFLMSLLSQMIQRQLIRRVVRQHQVDIIHQPIPVSPKEPSMIFGMGVPVVIGPMNGGMNYPPAFQAMESRLVRSAVGMGRFFADWMNVLIPGKRQAALLLVANQRTRAALPKGIGSRVVELVENGVDLAIWQPKPEIVGLSNESKSNESKSLLAAGAAPQPIRFIFVGRLVAWKAVDLLIEAFSRLAPELPISLEIIGDGVERSRLEMQAHHLGLWTKTEASLTQANPSPNRVEFLGWLSQVECARHLQRADVMVLPSLWECGGAVVLEAMAVGLPVIATNWGGPADYLNESCGILVDPVSREGLIAGLASAMRQLAVAPELRLAMGKAGRERVVQQFNWDVKAEQMLRLYQSVLETSPDLAEALVTEPVQSAQG